jgi:RNA polymerase sigma-70 factor (ECF subfamily)
VKVWRNIKKFDTKRSFKTWIYTIAKNTALDWLKRKQEIPFSSFETEESENPMQNIVDPLALPSVAFDRKLAAEKMNAIVGNLPEYYERVVSMHTKDQLTFNEISKKLRTPLNTVKSRYRRALRILRGRLEGSE